MQFKIDFLLAYSELRESQQTNHTGGYASNATKMQNIQQETATVIANLANTTLADRETMTSIQATITTLTLQLAKVNQQLADSLNVATIRKEKLVAATGSTQGGGGNGGAWTPVRPKETPQSYTHYCWTHGVESGHTSAQSTSPAKGHNYEATEVNKMNGRTIKWKHYGA